MSIFSLTTYSHRDNQAQATILATMNYDMANDIATEKQVSIKSHRNDIATGGGNNIATKMILPPGGGTNSHRSDIDTGVDSIIATCRGDSYYHYIIATI